jgi:hypothetical protein
MQRLLVLALTALLAFAPTAPAFAQEQKSRARAFFEPGTDISTTEKMAQEIEKCTTDNTNSRATCDELVRSFNAAFTELADFGDYRELANYFRSETRVVPCPQTPGPTRVGAVFGDKIEYIMRRFREGENCFFDDSIKRYVAAGCGQWTPDDLPIFTANNEPLAAPGPTPATPATFGRSNEALILPPRNPDAARRNDDDRSFMDRHGKKLLYGGSAAGALALLALLFRGSQEVNQTVCIGSPTCRRQTR